MLVEHGEPLPFPVLDDVLVGPGQGEILRVQGYAEVLSRLPGVPAPLQVGDLERVADRLDVASRHGGHGPEHGGDAALSQTTH